MVTVTSSDSDAIGSLLTALGVGAPRTVGESQIFDVTNEWMPHGRVFGGQLLAQSVMASSVTVDNSRAIHSMHGYFLRPAAPEAPTEIAVRSVRDGGSFSTRSVEVLQDGDPVFSMLASFQSPATGPIHQIDLPYDPPPAGQLSPLHDGLADPRRGGNSFWTRPLAFELRDASPQVVTQASPEAAIWMRATGSLPDEPLIHRAALAYACDHAMLVPLLNRHALTYTDPNLLLASLDHSMWWAAADIRVDDWLLMVQDSPFATGGRALGNARIYDQRGSLLATASQEALVRITDSPSEVRATVR